MSALIDALSDPSIYVRYSALNALGGLRSHAAIPAIKRMLDDKEFLPGKRPLAEIAAEILADHEMHHDS